MVFRVMRKKNGAPECGSSGACLGARIGPDKNDDLDSRNGQVYPGSGGMSVAHDSPSHLPTHRRPTWMGGTSKHALWRTAIETFVGDLSYRLDPDSQRDDGSFTHGFVEPGRPMPPAEYQSSLAGTQAAWQEVPPS